MSRLGKKRARKRTRPTDRVPVMSERSSGAAIPQRQPQLRIDLITTAAAIM